MTEEELMQQIHSGKRTFSRQEDAGGDAARFEREWLELLQSLERQGKITLSDVVFFHREGNAIPEKVDVVSVRVPPPPSWVPIEIVGA